ncbi:bis(5'-nucleosyl)-tetraphosphatase (symmetrical) YqeK [Fumia xinanensis]|uniref:bis(5'-nucleosyl)-tetraphosphatase (symmetrical) n=1 Tax=Fumia xinanensis TaxID=2763659 RepID=A0A926I675_9FIRM|nr:bis(5'-nucleosyl)-tetraphosphatase (symmetrical) YqeK [Fumia xinanensis]MBC8558571.1 bis(5'-nucleosyl)-tetraphosphatase (symmetrical) YqeK [Fumia xinanensis]
MIPWQEYDTLLRQKLSPKRYEHSIAVMERAVELAKRYGVDVDKARLAGLLHDIMKNEDKINLLQFIGNSDILLSVAEKNGPPLWHAIGGFLYARDVLKIEDADVLNAIRYHTTGRANMSPLEQVVYLADLTSSDRDYLDVEETRKRSEQSLHIGMLYSINFLICDLVKRGNMLHQDTVDCYNELIAQELNKNGKKTER